MADTEKYLLYIGVGFLGMLFLMSKFSFLRPAHLSGMSEIIDVSSLNPYDCIYSPTAKRYECSPPGYPETPSRYIGEKPS